MFPDEVMVDLFSRLPAKSIGRFRCVSKPWKSLLSQPHFTKTRLNRIKNLQIDDEESLVILVSRDSGSLYSAQMKNAHHLVNEITVSATELTVGDHYFDPSSIQMASCDGLILVMDEQNKLLLINPTTREFKVLPSSPDALDPLNWGIGYDSVADDYKVVVISYYTSDYMMYVNVYSVKNNTWKRVENCPFDHPDVEEGKSVVSINGHIYWVADVGDLSIAGFNLEEEEIYDVNFSGYVNSKDTTTTTRNSTDSDESDEPYDCSEECQLDDLVALGGCLCFYPESTSDTCHEMFVAMKEEYDGKECWTRISFNECRSLFRPICLLGRKQKQKQMVLVMDEEDTNEKLMMYNFEEETFKDIVVNGIPESFGVGGSFMESLVSPHCSSEAV
ncbi:hypothetical protein SOVF_212870 [Spinacia oleracea]|nr:hypothetical protein SOVF_212870 [Spinacia oleracea]